MGWEVYIGYREMGWFVSVKLILPRVRKRGGIRGPTYPPPFAQKGGDKGALVSVKLILPLLRKRGGIRAPTYPPPFAQTVGDKGAFVSVKLILPLLSQRGGLRAVSYTLLTLPTLYPAQLPVCPLTLNKTTQHNPLLP